MATTCGRTATTIRRATLPPTTCPKVRECPDALGDFTNAIQGSSPARTAAAARDAWSRSSATTSAAGTAPATSSRPAAKARAASRRATSAYLLTDTSTLGVPSEHPIAAPNPSDSHFRAPSSGRSSLRCQAVVANQRVSPWRLAGHGFSAPSYG